MCKEQTGMSQFLAWLSFTTEKSPSRGKGSAPRLDRRSEAPVSSLGTFWQPMRDGQRFLVLRPAESAQGKPITIVTNWQAGRKK
jgi:hypothetical protein